MERGGSKTPLQGPSKVQRRCRVLGQGSSFKAKAPGLQGLQRQREAGNEVPMCSLPVSKTRPLPGPPEHRICSWI